MHLLISGGMDVDSFQLLVEVQSAIQKIENQDRTDRGEIMTKVCIRVFHYCRWLCVVQG